MRREISLNIEVVELPMLNIQKVIVLTPVSISHVPVCIGKYSDFYFCNLNPMKSFFLLRFYRLNVDYFQPEVNICYENRSKYC